MNEKNKKSLEQEGAERRQSPRYFSTNFTWFKIIDSTGQDSTEGISKSFDISLTGIGLHHSQGLSSGKYIFLEIVRKAACICVAGKIVYSKKENDNFFRVGVEFVVVPPNSKVQLKKISS
jgi:c-di-GMP-binding flagellar brake protein YcgR